jgi:hypothetical protein
MLRHHAALVSGKLTRVPSGVNFPPSEVIMSRLLPQHGRRKKRQRQENREQCPALYGDGDARSYLQIPQCLQVCQVGLTIPPTLLFQADEVIR